MGGIGCRGFSGKGERYTAEGGRSTTTKHYGERCDGDDGRMYCIAKGGTTVVCTNGGGGGTCSVVSALKRPLVVVAKGVMEENVVWLGG